MFSSGGSDEGMDDLYNSYLGNTYKGYLQFPKGKRHCIFDAPKQDFPGKPERTIYPTDVFWFYWENSSFNLEVPAVHV